MLSLVLSLNTSRRVSRNKKEDIALKLGSEKIFTFLASDAIGLEKAVILVRLRDKGNIEFATMDFSLVNPPERTFIPIYV
jgi:hypothetical protein